MICPRFLSAFYLTLHNVIYKRRKNRARRFGMRVVSVGNLSMGGTGKTPLVQYLARHCLKRKPMVVLRGYGGRASALVSDGRQLLSDYAHSGDEAIVLASLAGLRVAAGRDRGALIEEHGGESGIVFLDDAFQNPSIHRDLDLVLVDASVPFKKLRVVPCGHFREDLSALSRASAVLLTRCDAAHADDWAGAIAAACPGLPLFRSVHEFGGLRNAAGSPMDPPAVARAFCGIGNPSAFFSMLEGAGISLASREVFRDHHAYTAADIRGLQAEGSGWITTEKDAVRLSGHEDFVRSIWIAGMRLRILDDEQSFLRLVLGEAKER